tara:strand:- start:659 stop:1543 length:885 start_codon:yes stop_codon:yes gene_type:complete
MNVNYKKILVTGSEGFIATELIKRLKELNYEVIGVDLLNDEDLKSKVFVDSLPDVDVVFHLAALNGTKWFYEKPYDVVLNNSLSTLNLIERYKESVDLFIFSGTCESYAGTIERDSSLIPTPETIPLSIEDILNPRWSYGGSKLGNEINVISAFHQFNMNFQILRYHNIYGPTQKDHFFPEFIEKVKKGKYELVGFENTRSFLHVSDAIDYTVELFRNPEARNNIINVGSDHEITIKKVAELILSKMNLNKELNLLPSPKGSVLRRIPCLKKLKSFCGEKNLISLEDGIESMIR